MFDKLKSLFIVEDTQKPAPQPTPQTNVPQQSVHTRVRAQRVQPRVSVHPQGEKGRTIPSGSFQPVEGLVRLAQGRVDRGESERLGIVLIEDLVQVHEHSLRVGRSA